MYRGVTRIVQVKMKIMTLEYIIILSHTLPLMKITAFIFERNQSKDLGSFCFFFKVGVDIAKQQRNSKFRKCYSEHEIKLLQKIYLSGLIETNSTFERFIYISTFDHFIIAYLIARRMYQLYACTLHTHVSIDYSRISYADGSLTLSVNSSQTTGLNVYLSWQTKQYCR